jgi:hypothetical protein
VVDNHSANGFYSAKYGGATISIGLANMREEKPERSIDQDYYAWMMFLREMALYLPIHNNLMADSLSKEEHEALSDQIKRLEEIERLKVYRSYLQALVDTPTMHKTKEHFGMAGMFGFSYRGNALKDQLAEEINLVNQRIGELIT